MFVFGGFVDHNQPNSTRVESSFNFIISFLYTLIVICFPLTSLVVYIEMTHWVLNDFKKKNLGFILLFIAKSFIKIV